MNNVVYVVLGYNHDGEVFKGIYLTPEKAESICDELNSSGDDWTTYEVLTYVIEDSEYV